MKTLDFKKADGYSATIIRATLFLIIFPHGGQHLFGWFGGFGFTGFTNWLIEAKHLPSLVAYLVPLIEFIAPILLVLGLGSRVVSVLLTVLFTGIIFADHIEHGFFMNWLGNLKGEGYEYHLLIIGMCISIIFSGDGNLSLHNYIKSKTLSKRIDQH